MSQAPERIYLDGDVAAGDGMFPRCFENPKYASEPQVEYVRIDLVKAAEQRGYVIAIEAERKLHEGRIEELEATIEAMVGGKIDVVVELTKLKTHLEDLFAILEKTEQKDDGRYFHPTTIRSSRALDAERLDKILAELKRSITANDKSDGKCGD